MNLRLSLTMLAAAALAACQSAPAPGAEAALAAGATGPSEGPELICRMELVSGSRVRKQEVCSPAKFNSEAGDSFRQHLNNDLNNVLPADAGGG